MKKGMKVRKTGFRAGFELGIFARRDQQSWPTLTIHQVPGRWW